MPFTLRTLFLLSFSLCLSLYFPFARFWKSQSKSVNISWCWCSFLPQWLLSFDLACSYFFLLLFAHSFVRFFSVSLNIRRCVLYFAAHLIAWIRLQNHVNKDSICENRTHKKSIHFSLITSAHIQESPINTPHRLTAIHIEHLQHSVEYETKHQRQ